jgi:hypothetical protein
MIPLLYVGVLSLLSSFSVSHFITSEYLRYTYVEPKKKLIVKFDKIIRVRTIPSVRSLSSNTLNKLWYTGRDYARFKQEYINNMVTKYNTI